jgi:hypothetical protein
MHCLRGGAYDSIEQLAEANGFHPKVVRQGLRLPLSFSGSHIFRSGRQAIERAYIGANPEAVVVGAAPVVAWLSCNQVEMSLGGIVGSVSRRRGGHHIGAAGGGRL